MINFLLQVSHGQWIISQNGYSRHQPLTDWSDGWQRDQ